MLQIQSLTDSIANIDLEELMAIFSQFKCEKDEDIESFLSNVSIEYETKNVARTFLVMDTDYPGEIIGYFTIGLNVMRFDEKLDVKDAYEGVNLYENNYRPIYKLFMIGKNDLYHDYKHKMSYVFNKYIIPYLKRAQKVIAGELVYIDCDPGENNKLKHLYEKLGFVYYDDTSNSLIRMIRKI